MFQCARDFHEPLKLSIKVLKLFGLSFGTDIPLPVKPSTIENQVVDHLNISFSGF